MPRFPYVLSFAAFTVFGMAGQAQQQIPPQPPANVPTPLPTVANAIAATVNNQQIPELAVTRALRGKTDASNDKRQEVLNYLIENALVDQYLEQLKVQIEPKEVDAQFIKVKSEIESTGKKMLEFLEEMRITEPELKTQIHATLRWDKFIEQYANDKTLKDFFEANKALFDGTSMRAKHILVTVPSGDAQGAAQAKAKIALVKRQIEERVAKGLAEAGKLDNLELQKKKMQLLNDTFAEMAGKESSCPSKANGGELGWFPRSGARVGEQFANAAFALKPWEMSDAVATEYGYHLILCVEFKAGIERKFEDIREIVKEVYADKMRAAIVARMRPTAKIAINQAPR
jgi:peptidyl-prolyl cis-trans isomerase C